MASITHFEDQNGEPDRYDYRFDPDYQAAVERNYRRLRDDAGADEALPGDSLFSAWHNLSVRSKGIALTAAATGILALGHLQDIGRGLVWGAHRLSGDNTPANPIIDQNVIKLGENEGLISEGYPLDPQAGQLYYDQGRLMMIHETLNKQLVSLPYERWSGEQQQAEYQKITGHPYTGQVGG